MTVNKKIFDAKMKSVVPKISKPQAGDLSKSPAGSRSSRMQWRHTFPTCPSREEVLEVPSTHV